LTSNNNIYKNEYNRTVMVNKLISIRISEELLNDIDTLTKSQGYSNTQEFIRAAAREKIQKEKIAQATIELKKLWGSVKKKISA